jgi:hypothetical protein
MLERIVQIAGVMIRAKLGRHPGFDRIMSKDKWGCAKTPLCNIGVKANAWIVSFSTSKDLQQLQTTLPQFTWNRITDTKFLVDTSKPVGIVRRLAQDEKFVSIMPL